MHIEYLHDSTNNKTLNKVKLTRGVYIRWWCRSIWKYDNCALIWLNFFCKCVLSILNQDCISLCMLSKLVKNAYTINSVAIVIQNLMSWSLGLLKHN